MVPRYRPMEERILKFSRKETLREASQAAGIGQQRTLNTLNKMRLFVPDRRMILLHKLKISHSW
jgi:hypothetical protein